MNKFVCAAVIGTLAFTTAISTRASAAMPVHPAVVVTSSSSTAGAAAVGGFLGVVAALDVYDFVRRTTCSGDFWVSAVLVSASRSRWG